MASRSFIVVSAAALGGILVSAAAALYLLRAPAPAPAPEPGPAPPTAAKPYALGVGGADYDGAGRRDDDGVLRDNASLPEAFAHGSMLERPSRELEPPAPPSEPIAADPGLIALTAASAAVQPQVAAEVASLLDHQRDALRAACWPGGDAAKFAIEASFDPAGKPLSLAIPDHSDLPDVSACLRAQLSLDSLTLAAPPTAAATVTVELTLP